MASVNWLEKPEAHDFPAAAEYLALLADPSTVKKLTKRLQAGQRRTQEGQGHSAGGAAESAARRQPARRDRPREDRKGATAVAHPAGARRLRDRCSAPDRRRLPPGLRELSHRREHRHTGCPRDTEPRQVGRPAPGRSAHRAQCLSVIVIEIQALKTGTSSVRVLTLSSGRVNALDVEVLDELTGAVRELQRFGRRSAGRHRRRPGVQRRGRPQPRGGRRSRLHRSADSGAVQRLRRVVLLIPGRRWPPSTVPPSRADVCWRVPAIAA